MIRFPYVWKRRGPVSSLCFFGMSVAVVCAVLFMPRSASGSGSDHQWSRRNQPPLSLTDIPVTHFHRTSSQASSEAQPPLVPSVSVNPPSGSPSPRLVNLSSGDHVIRSSSSGSHPHASRYQSSSHDLSTQSIAARTAKHAAADPKLSHFRGYVRCRWCQAFTENDGVAVEAHQAECPFLPMPCSFTDSESSEPCPTICKGKKMLLEHQARCPFRRIRCTSNCGALVSVHSLSRHLQVCSQQPVECTICHSVHPRSADVEHGAHCDEAVVDCPLGCGLQMRRRDVPEHIKKTAATHQNRFPCRGHANQPIDARIPADSPAVVISLLLDKIHELEHCLRRGGGGGGEKSVDHPAAAAAVVAATPTKEGRNDSNNADAHCHSSTLTTFDVSPFSPKDRSSQVVDEAQTQSTVFSVLVPPSDIARISLIGDPPRRISEARKLTEVLLEALRLHDSKTKILENEDVVLKRTTLEGLRVEVDAAVQRARRMWRICGLDNLTTSVSSDLCGLRDLATQVHRCHVAVKCALYDCI